MARRSRRDAGVIWTAGYARLVVLPRLSFLAPVALAAAACAPEAPLDDGLITWAGYVYTGPQVDTTYSARTTEGAAVHFIPDLDEGEGSIAATEPYEDYPGYWSVDVPPGVHLTIRVDTSPVAVWRATSPEVDASWLPGALFGADRAEMDALLGALGAEATSSAPMVVGTPWDDGWDCANLRVAGALARCFLVDDEGVVSEITNGDLSYFVAADLEPGEATLQSGLGGEDVYPLEGSDIGLAFWFVGAS